jgi:cysteine desulfurase
MERIYLDYNATSIIDSEVTKWMVDLLSNQISLNPSSIHADGRKARAMMEDARAMITQNLAINSKLDDVGIIFTSSGTEANNLAISNFQGNPFFVSAAEHVSVLDIDHPNKIIIPVDKNGLVRLEELSSLLKQYPGKKIVSIMLANNETGAINDIKSLSEVAHSEGAIFHCDGSQAFCKIKIDFNDLGCDLLTISSHKSGGPVGAAALVAKKSLALKPVFKGGKQEQGLRAGTENLLAIGGFAVAAQYCDEKVQKFIEIEALRDYLEQEISKVAPITILSKEVLRLPNTSCLSMPGIKNEEQLIKFDLAGISLSAGSACSSGRIAGSHVLKAMGLDEKIASEFIRVSLGLRTTKEQIDKFIEIWKGIYKK